MKTTERIQTALWKTAEWFKGVAWKLASLYHPANLKQKGLLASAGLLIAAALVFSLALGWYWSQEPDSFDVQQVALQRFAGDEAQLRVGVIFTSTLIHVGEVLLDKPGGYLSNDVMPPGLWLDNMPNWEYGALVMLRDGAAALRNHMSRSQSQSVEDAALAEAEPRFNFRNDSWLFPPSEGEYRKGMKALDDYMRRLADPANQQAQFYARADNLRQYLEIVEKRLGSLSQRLSASVGQIRVNTDLAGDVGAKQSTTASTSVVVKTPWLKLDDVFYESRGATWALGEILKAVEYDFEQVLKKKNALVSLRQIIRELEEAQQPTLSPVIINGSGFGLFANYSLTMANYIARANAAIIDLRDLLQQG
ncbi:hypothetical protein DFR30_0466 [Thiogranum longum]|uniref:DUF2333 family protein n=1 Tax=Thiogranum longum TaxID=1537524 RepID=A0A4R1H695_9GAMM|nr:DUF2333 family protein [Thiogranum longum]TCK17244.1 hypothetical protein DFR30_0466 [Thiogranum longum]